MKKINKVLALVLAMIMLVMAMPLSVLADAWVKVDAETKKDTAGDTVDSVVTVTLDPTVLLELIKTKGLSTDLLFALKDGMAIDKSALLEIFTVEELFELIPKDRWMDVFDFDKIIDEIGLDVLSQYIQTDDYAAWLNDILDGDVKKFTDLVADIPNLEECVNPTLLYQMGYLVPTKDNIDAGKTIYDLIADHVYDPDALAGMLIVDGALINRVNTELDSMTIDQIREMVDIQAMANDGYFSASDLATEAAERARMRALVSNVATLQQILKPSNGYVDGVKVLERLGIEFVMEHVSGGAAAVINPRIMDLCPATGLISELDLVATLTKVLNGLYNDLKPDGTVLVPEDLFDYDKMIDALDALDMLDDVIESVGVNALFARFSNAEILELVKKVELTPYIKPVVTMVLGQILDNVKLVKIDGMTVAQATADGAQQLQINAGELLKALTAIVPSFDDLLADSFDGTVLSTTIRIDYKVADTTDPDYGVIKSKSVTLKAVLGGGEAALDKFQNGVEKVKKLYNVYINQFGLAGTELTLDVNAPEQLAQLLKLIVNSDKLPADLVKKLATLADGDNLYTFVSGDLTFDNLYAILEAVELEELYEIIRNVGFVQTLLEKIDEKTGSTLAENTLQDFVDFIVADTHTLNELCDIVSNKLGYNVKAILEKAAIKFDAAADRATKIALVQKALGIVESKTGIDLTGISAEEILDKAGDKPIIDTIANFVSDKLGRDVQDILSTYTVDELYDKALEKVVQYEDKAEALLSKARALVEKIANKYPNHSISNWYQGNGVFGFEADLTVTPKVWLEKLVNKITGRFNLDTAAIDLLMSCISDEEMTFKADLTVRFDGLYQIKFMGNDAVNDPYAAPLYTAFLPAGADLSIFKNNPVTTRFDFASWWTYDENGNQVAIDTMPAGDTVVYTNGIQTENQVADGWGYITYITDPYWKLEYGLKITISREILDRAANGDPVTYEIRISKNNGASTPFVKFDNATLRMLASVPGDVSFYYGNGYNNAVNAGNSGFAGGVYDQTKVGAESAPEYHSFKLVGGAGEITVFGGEITITLPYSGQMSTNPVRTEVYTTADGKREWIDNATLDFANGLVTFKTTHFSDFVILNSYKLDVKFVTGDGIAVNAKIKDFDQAHPYYPAGYELKFADFYDFGVYDKIVKIVASVGGNDTDYTGQLSYVLTGDDVILTVTLENVYYIYYYVNGVKWDAATIEYYTSELVDGSLPESKPLKTFDDLLAYVESANDASLLPPAGYELAGAWVGYDPAFLGKADMNVFAKWAPTEYKYTITLMVGEKVYGTLEVNSTETDPYAVLANADLPAVPAKAGYTGEWTVVTTFANERSFTLVATYTPKNYMLVLDEGVYVYYADDANKTLYSGGLFAVGSELQITTEYNAHFDMLAKVALATKDENGNEVLVKVNEGKFTMPADTVYVTVTLEPKTYSYTFDGITAYGKYGETAIIEVLVPADKILVEVQGDAECVILSEKLNKNGSMTMTFGFVITADDMTFTAVYADKTTTPVVNVFGGSIYTGDGDPEVDVDNVKFDGWSKALKGVSFAKFAYDDSQLSLWAPWILVALVIFLLLIIILYLLNRAGKMGKNFLVAFAILVVEAFLALCLKVAALFIKIGHLFGKGKNASDYGFVEEETAEELPEDNAEEDAIAEEATAEEATAEEATAEEATKEEATAEEATEATDDKTEE